MVKIVENLSKRVLVYLEESEDPLCLPKPLLDDAVVRRVGEELVQVSHNRLLPHHLLLEGSHGGQALHLTRANQGADVPDHRKAMACL